MSFDDLLDIASVRKRLYEAGVQTHDIFLNGGKHLVIPGVNTREVAEKIRAIPLPEDREKLAAV